MILAGLRVPVRLEAAAVPLLDDVAIWASRNTPVRVVSANDHIHARGSRHYLGKALDLHSDRMDALAAYLGQLGYRVLWNVRGHYGHVHAEVAE